MSDNKDIKKPHLTPKEKAYLLTRQQKTDICKQYGLQAEGFHYHWANADGAKESMVARYEEVGYTKCLDKNKQIITRRGQIFGVCQVLMRIPIENYNEIQYYKLDEVRETERSIGLGRNERNQPIHGLENNVYGDVVTTSDNKVPVIVR